MSVEYQRFVGVWLAHVQVLAQQIGPRGSTTQGERLGSEYCARVLGDLGLKPQTETFRSARSIYLPYVLAQITMLIAFAIYPLAGRATAAAAAVLSIIAIYSATLELGIRDNPLRRVAPKGQSQNVISTIAPSVEHQQDLVLIGHVDSHRTPLIFSSVRWFTAFRVFTPLTFTLGILQMVFYLLGTVTQWVWVWPATIPGAVAGTLLIAHHLHADRTPFSAGANDNATGAGLVLTLAEHFLQEPLKYTRVWLACTGCEEVQHYGAADFFQRHRDAMLDPVTVVFETLGCAGPAWLTREGVVVPFRASSELVALAAELAATHREWGARPARVDGGNTEMADALRAGSAAITLIGMGPEGVVPHVHQAGDTYDKMDPEIMARAYDFAWTFIRALDDKLAGD
jgi:hypothetical protein